MKKILCLITLVAVILTGCSTSQREDIIVEETITYQTLLSPENELSIVREPSTTNFGFLNPGYMPELPSYNKDSNDPFQVNLRCSDLTLLDLEDRLDDLLYSVFDSKTKWTDKLPTEFNPKEVMTLGKDPGLGVRDLHDSGITGKGVGVAIIDQSLLVNHIEYKDRLKLYEEIHHYEDSASIHGAGVASIAVGNTVGVAPEADLYYIAVTNGILKVPREIDYDLKWLAESIDRIVEVNKLIPVENRIRVISISLGIRRGVKGYKDIKKAIENAENEGIYTLYVDTSKFLGLGRNPLQSADDLESYTRGEFYKDESYGGKVVLVPMDSRCVASPTGSEDYVFYRIGGMSWAVPYMAGLYALACQVKPDITPELFWQEALNTSDNRYKDGSKIKFGKIINPVKLMEKLKEIE